jgi:hypothetical protein
MVSVTWARFESLGVFGVGNANWWGIENPDEAAKSLDGVRSSLLREGLSWLGRFKSRSDVFECLVPDTPQAVKDAVAGSFSASLPAELDQLPTWFEADTLGQP